MLIKETLHKLNLSAQCRNMGVGLWSCPQFIFLVMGTVIISTIILTYTVGQRYVEAHVIVLIVLFATVFLLIVSFVVVRAFERIVGLRKSESEQAKEILELKDQFVFLAAHELRTPANAIKWGLGALHSERPDLVKEQEELFGILKRGSDRLLLLVNDLLEVTRIESGVVELDLKEISANDSFAQACEEIVALREEREVAINWTAGDLPLVRGDSTRLKEVFLNLISNAIKYSKKGSSVEVSAEVKDNMVIFHVADKGVGLNKDDQEHLFEKFWRSKETKDIEGTGLGLFITEKLVELMAGKIWFTSKKDLGTTFSFSLNVANTNK